MPSLKQKSWEIPSVPENVSRSKTSLPRGVWIAMKRLSCEYTGMAGSFIFENGRLQDAAVVHLPPNICLKKYATALKVPVADSKKLLTARIKPSIALPLFSQY